ncbi:MAG: hypothetical protein QUV07_02380 [Cyanobium sp. CZS 25K]|nr:hypothetical protein [Cyanobium sp. CZS25K]
MRGNISFFDNFSKVSLKCLKRLHKPMSLLGLSGLGAMASVAMGVAQPAQAAISCPALPVTGLPGGPVNNGAPCGTVDASTGAQQFTVDFASVIASNPADFDLTNYFSLQAASIQTGVGSTISFSDVRFLVTGTDTMMGVFTDQSIAVWQDLATLSADPTSQGFSNYSVSEAVTTGFGTNYKTASFSLTPGTANVTTGLNAGVINTTAFQPSAFGINTLTNLKITGLIRGGSVNGGAAGFGLANFQGYNTFEPFLGGPPNGVFGRAANVNTVPTPGPLPLFGAAAAFGWSRKLRRRLGATKIAA